jgi:filamentous hemagglutinin
MKTASTPRKTSLRVIAHVLAALQVLPPGVSWAQSNAVGVRERNAQVIERESQAQRIAARIERERRAQAAAGTTSPSTNVTADASAPKNQRPIVGVAANGVPVVLIAAPAANGVSHNRYSEFNVGANGLVLNNSGGNAQTQIAGWVQGNPFLGNNSARIILNEVSGQLPTSLRGQIEVAGRAADVIIANPNGIACNGCGFINTPRATLTTGTPVYAQDGVLVGFAVQRGAVSFDGQGVNARNVDQLDILAQSVRANAEVWANKLNVITGANLVEYNSGKVNAQTANATPAAVSLDVSQLGGMYANSVRLVGTQQGLGVNSQGTIAAINGELEITQSGDIRLAGRTQASGSATVKGANVHNSGTLVADSASLIGAAVHNDGSVISRGNIGITAQSLSGSGTLAAGIDTKGEATQNGALRLTASSDVTLQGARLIAGSDVQATGASVSVRDGLVSGQRITLGGDQGVNVGGSDVRGTDSVTLRTQSVLTTDGATVESRQLTLQGRSLQNRGGTLTHTSDSALTISAADSIDNRGGTIAANAQDLTLQGGTRLDNSGGGEVRHAGSGTLTVTAQNVDNSGGALRGNGAISADAATLNNRGGTISAQGALGLIATDTAGTLDNSGGSIAGGGTLAVISRGHLDNRGGTITGSSLTAATRVQADGTLTNARDGNGVAAEINANAALAVNAGTLINDNGRIASGQSLTVTSGAMTNSGSAARVLADKDVTLNIASLDNNSGAVVDAKNGNVTVTASGAVTNSGASSAIQSAGVTTLTATGITNSGLVTGATTTVDAGRATLRNQQGGRIVGTNLLTASGTGLANDASLLRSGGALTADARSGTLANNNSGTEGGLVADGALTVLGQALNNRGGVIDARGAVKLETVGALDNSAGLVRGANAVNVTANAALDNRGGAIQSASTTHSVTVRTDGALDNSALGGQAGEINANAGLAVTAGSVINTNGRIAARNLSVTSGAMSTSGANARVLADNSLTLDVASLTQGAGGVIDGRDVTITTRGGAVNNAGTVQSGGLTHVSATGIANIGLVTGQTTELDARGASLRNEAGGRIGANGTLTAGGAGLTNDAALMRAGGALTLDARGGTLANTNSGRTGGLVADGAVTLRGSALDNSAGYVEAGATLAVPSDTTTTTTINNRAGTLYSRGSATLTAGSLDNTGGLVEALGDVTVTTTGGDVHNTSTATQTSRIAAGGALAVTSASLDNRAAGAAAANAADVGLTGANVTATITNTLDNRGGFLRAADTLAASAALLDNRGGTIAAGNPAAPAQADGLRALGTARIERTATLNNGQDSASPGLLYATRLLDVDVGSLQGSGSLSSRGDLSLNVQGAHDNASGISAERDATVTTAGTLTNRTRIEAGGVLTVTAPDIANTASGEIVATDLRVTATGNLANHGLIDGGRVRVQAGTIDNHGRLYGDELAIGATTLNNMSTGAIASRGTLDIGVTTLNNQPGAELFSEGDMRIGRTLDANGRATGSATTVTNNGARIEALGSLSVDAAAINNLNVGFRTQLRTVGTETVALNNVPGTSLWLADSEVAFQDKPGNYGLRANFAALRRNDETYALTVYGGDPADKLVFGVGRRPPVYEPSFDAYTCDNEQSNCVFAGRVPAVYRLGSSDPLWAGAGVAPPSAHATEEQREAAYAALQAQVDAFNAQWSRYKEWTHIAGTKTLQETEFIGGQAGQILAGGNITLRGAVDNQISRVVAGGQLDISGASVANTGASGVRVEHTVGRSIYTRIDRDTFGDDDRVFDRTAYDSGEITTPLVNVGATAPQALRTGSNPEIDLANQAGIKANANGAAAARTAAQAVVSQSSTLAVQSVQAGRSTVEAAVGLPALSAGTAVERNAVAAVQGPTRITTQLPSITLPTSSLFNVSTAPGRAYLVETDPQFTNYRQWASSDVLLAQLGAQTTLQRLGDGYYEQRLVGEQIMAATGQRYLGDHRDTEAQYLALLNAGAEFGKQYDLTLGVALTEAQMSLLTSDMVWLVAQNVTLADGSVQRVLVPQVYVRVGEGDLRADGTLMAGNSVRLQLQGDLANSGTLLGRRITDIRAENIGNAGRIGSSDLALMTARNDLTSSGSINGARVGLDAGNDIKITTQTSTSSGPNASRTSIDRVASVNASQLLVASAGRDITLTGAHVTSGGTLTLDAARDLNLASVNVAEAINIRWDARNQLATGTSSELGSTVKAQGDITLRAGQDVNARAAYVTSDAGAITATAGRDIVIANGQASSRSQEDRYIQDNSSGFGPKGSLLARETDSSRSTETHTRTHSTQVQASTFSADSVNMTAGRDLGVRGSNIVASNDLSLSAQRDLTLTSAEQSSNTSQRKDEQRSGFGAMGGISNGAKNVEQANTSASTTQVGSNIGSLQGNVSLTAGNDYRQTASAVQALNGDIAIAGANVTIDTAANTQQGTQELRMRQSGASLTFSSPIVNTLQGIVQTAETAGQAQDSRTQALATANTAMAAYNAYNSLATASALNISLSVGNSRSQSHSEQSASVAATSSVNAGGDLTISANGKEPGQGNLTAIGANLSAGNNATLSATNDIDLRAAQNTATQRSSNSSSSASVGIGFSLGGAQNGFTINAAASQARGNSDGTDVTNTLTTVSAGNNLTLTSGRDTSLIGAVASGNQVTATVGRNLDIQSVQDTSTYTSKESSVGVGVSICVYPLCVGTSSASISASSGRANGNFASVAEQSGLRAGDGGFQVNVQGNTNLTGAAITSSQAALDGNKNSLSTTTLTQSEIQNRDNHRASSIAVSASYTSARTEYNPDTDQAQTARNRDGSLSQASNSQGLGVGSISGSQGSTTTSAISGATVTIKSGDTTALATINRTAVTETANANTLTRNWNGQQLQQDANTQAQQMLSFGQSASRLVGDYAGSQFARLMAEANAAGDTPQGRALADEAARWGEGGAYRVALHTVVGGLSGGGQGALGAGTSAVAAPIIANAVNDMGLPEPVRQAVIAVGTTAVSGAVGGTTGAAAGFNQVANNYLKHEEAVRMGTLNDKCRRNQCSTAERTELQALIDKDIASTQQLNGCITNLSAACNAVRADYQAVQNSYRPSAAEIDAWAQIKAAQSGGRYSAAQIADAYRANALGQAPTQTTGGDLNPAADWVRQQMAGEPPMSRIYLGMTSSINASASTVFGLAVVSNQAAAAQTRSRVGTVTEASVAEIDPRNLLWTQRTAGGNGRADNYRETIGAGQWPWDPIDVVRTPAGLTTVDHTRAAVALELGVNSIPARVHLPGDPLPAEMQGRFGNAMTWGEAVEYRASNQRPPLPPEGTPTPPTLPRPRPKK